MTEYKKGSIGYFLELAKKDGFDNLKDWNEWRKKTGNMPNYTEIDRLAKRKSKIDHLEKKKINENKNHHAYSLMYHPCSKEFQEEAKKLGLTGNQYLQKLIEGGKIVHPNDIDHEYRENLAKVRGYENYTEHLREFCWDNGEPYGPMLENENCSLYTGVRIGEEQVAKPILLAVFENIDIKKPTNNPGFDAICGNVKSEFIDKYPIFRLIQNKKYKVDVKTVRLKSRDGRISWKFPIKCNNISDYFLLIGLNDEYEKEKIEILHIWLFMRDEIVRGRKFWRRETFGITNKPKFLLEIEKYELKDELNELKKIINI